MNKNIKLLFTVFVLGLCWATIYTLPFLQYLLYDPFIEGLGCNNAQLGLLMSIFGFGNILGAPIGGWIADRFNYKKVFLASLLGNGILAVIFAFNMNYKSAVIIWVLLAVTSLCMNYPSHIKIVRMLVDEDNQGKIFGMNEAFVGVGSVLSSSVLLFIFAKYVNVVAGLKAVVFAIAAVSFICFAASYFMLKDSPAQEDADDSKASEPKKNMTFADFMSVLKSPATWLVGINIFAVYSLSVTMSYFTPYFTTVLGISVAFSGSLAVIRIHGLRLVGAPFGGWLADKIKSVSKVLMVIYICGAAVLLAFMKMPKTTSIYVLIGITLVIGFLVYMGRGIYYALASEIKIPREYAASTVGIAAALGFLPDVFQFAMFGNWIDKHGAAAYTYMFTYQIIVLLVGIIGSFAALQYKKRVTANNETTSKSA